MKGLLLLVAALGGAQAYFLPGCSEVSGVLLLFGGSV